MNSHHRNQARGDPGKTDNPADRSALSRQPQRGTVPLALEVIAMSKRFGTFVALDQVSQRVHTGSMHALLGENGAGKSTLVKCIIADSRGLKLTHSGAHVLDGVTGTRKLHCEVF